jgi:hypothetical protein
VMLGMVLSWVRSEVPRLHRSGGTVLRGSPFQVGAGRVGDCF